MALFDDVFLEDDFKGVAKDGVRGTLKAKSVEGVECRGPASDWSMGGGGRRKRWRRKRWRRKGWEKKKGWEE